VNAFSPQRHPPEADKLRHRVTQRNAIFWEIDCRIPEPLVAEATEPINAFYRGGAMTPGNAKKCNFFFEID
jgi:hypothetical protein